MDFFEKKKSRAPPRVRAAYDSDNDGRENRDKDQLWIEVIFLAKSIDQHPTTASPHLETSRTVYEQ